MSGPPDKPQRSEGDFVGYRHPPGSTQFKPGNNANPRGRPKKAKTVFGIIEREMTRRIKITVDGRPQWMMLQEIIIRNLGNEAARNNFKAINTLFALWERYRDSSETVLDPDTLPANDQAIIAEFLANAKSALPTDEPVGAEPADAANTERGEDDNS